MRAAGAIELWRSLGALAERPAPEHAALARLLGLGEPPVETEHTDLFLFQLYPYSSVYLGADGMLGGEARDRVAGFLRTLGLEPAPEPDHLASLLAAYAGLGEREGEAADTRGREVWRRARRAFFHEHLLPWLPVYLLRLRELASPFYRCWGELLLEALEAAAKAAGPAAREPLAFRLAPPPADPREQGSEAFLASLLAPLRSGLLLVRDDLRRAARDLGLAPRTAERRYVLESLLAQDPWATLRWLAAEAERWAEVLEAFPVPAFRDVLAFWSRRTRATETLLQHLASE